MQSPGFAISSRRALSSVRSNSIHFPSLYTLTLPIAAAGIGPPATAIHSMTLIGSRPFKFPRPAHLTANPHHGRIFLLIPRKQRIGAGQEQRSEHDAPKSLRLPESRAEIP